VLGTGVHASIRYLGVEIRGTKWIKLLFLVINAFPLKCCFDFFFCKILWGCHVSIFLVIVSIRVKPINHVISILYKFESFLQNFIWKCFSQPIHVTCGTLNKPNILSPYSSSQNALTTFFLANLYLMFMFF